jgi:hypothetical protein
MKFGLGAIFSLRAGHEPAQKRLSLGLLSPQASQSELGCKQGKISSFRAEHQPVDLVLDFWKFSMENFLFLQEEISS